MSQSFQSAHESMADTLLDTMVAINTPMDMTSTTESTPLEVDPTFESMSKKRPSSPMNPEDLPAAKRVCSSENTNVAENEVKETAKEMEESEEEEEEAELKKFKNIPYTIREITAAEVAKVRSTKNPKLSSRLTSIFPRGITVLDYKLLKSEIILRTRAPLPVDDDDDEEDVCFENFVPAFSMRHACPEAPKTVTDVKIENGKRIVTTVTTSHLLQSSHPLEQAWLDKLDFEDAENMEDVLFDMSKSNVSSIITPLFHRQWDVLVCVTVTDGPVTQNMICSALEQVLRQSITLELRKKLWHIANAAGNLMHYEKRMWECDEYDSDIGFEDDEEEEDENDVNNVDDSA
jgi:hypothetical protein